MRKLARAVEAGDCVAAVEPRRPSGRGVALDGFCDVCGALTNHYVCGCPDDLAICEFDAVMVETGHIATLAHTGDVTTVRVHEAPIMDVSEKGSGL